MRFKTALILFHFGVFSTTLFFGLLWTDTSVTVAIGQSLSVAMMSSMAAVVFAVIGLYVLGWLIDLGFTFVKLGALILIFPFGRPQLRRAFEKLSAMEQWTIDHIVDFVERAFTWIRT